MSYESGDRWLKGPELHRWLLETVPDVQRRRLGRQMGAWKHGRTADLYYLEAHLCQWGIHPAEIPAECWTAQSPRAGNWRGGQALNPQLPGSSATKSSQRAGELLRSAGNIKSPRERRAFRGPAKEVESLTAQDPSAPIPREWS